MTWNEPAPLRGRRDDSCNQGHLRSSAPGYHYGNGVTDCDKNMNLVILRMRKMRARIRSKLRSENGDP